jgi:quinol monooxygenase YgiN
MITRIVRLSFKPEQLNNFIVIFNTNVESIKQFEGCKSVKLMQDADLINVLYTYSTWDSVECLNNYRSSALFNQVWLQTKRLFNDKPFAYSLSNYLS